MTPANAFDVSDRKTMAELFEAGPAAIDWSRVAKETPDLAALAVSLQMDGLHQAIQIDARGRIVDGVHRVIALWLMGYDGSVPVEEVSD